MNPNTILVLAIGLAVGIVIGAVLVYAVQQARTKSLKARFGPEYGRIVAETGNRSKAEAVLENRARRVKDLHIRTLDARERARFQEAWREIQSRFVDDPGGALREADLLIAEVMSVEGYPIQDFEQRAADISVNYPRVIENYREGHTTALKQSQGRATTEELRKAMVHYRSLFEELVGQPEWVAERTRT